MKYKDQELNIAHGDLMLCDRWHFFWKRRKEKICFKFRCGPVPFVHRCKWHKNTTYRAPAYRGMRQEYWKAIEDEVALRQKWNEIPDARDDYAKLRTKCWKKFRNTQYKPKSAS